jgi:NAD(P) transhydrogenase subunit alpha
MNFLVLLVIFVVATAVGYKLLRAVPPLLHTPLMSGMNALSGVTVLGALAATAAAVASGYRTFGTVAVALAAINVVGGFAVTHRMLRKFKSQPAEENDDSRP